MKNKNYDFSGWATRNDLKCSDGRTIRRDAFKDNDGKIVPLVWNHLHNSPDNVLGHALLENRKEGVYTYGFFNNTESGQEAKELVRNGDVTALSIYANKLKQDNGNVLHGQIREVSLVLSGANPGAFIDSIISHGEESDEEAIMYTGEEISLYHNDEEDKEEKDESEEVEKESEEKSEESEESEKSEESEEEESMEKEKLEHAEEEEKDENEETVQDVIDSLTDKQKKVVYAMIGEAINDAKNNDEGDEKMKHNVFDNDRNEQEEFLCHDDMVKIFENAQRLGSLKAAAEDYLAHAVYDKDGNEVTYGIADIDYLFPDYKATTNTPDFYKREDAWVSKVMSGVHHTPFSRIKSIFADITMDEARAKGYVKGNLKAEEVFGLLKRTTDPQTVYKKQKLDRDDILDITDFDVVAWLKGEMRMMLDEEIARAILIGDGRSTLSQDKIKEDHIRSVLNDDDFYSIKVEVTYAQADTDEDKAKKNIKAIIKSRKDYKGSGNPVFFTTEDQLTDMLLIEDSTGRVIYDTEEKLKTALRVRDIITVPVMEGVTRTTRTNDVKDVIGIIVNLNDYNVGADKGGQTSLFDDFDIDYNQYKYLIETRISGALTKPKSAIVIETAHVAETVEEPAAGEGE